MNTEAQASFPVATILFFIFLVLKLTDVIDWSWWWVTAPLWGPALLVILLLVIILTVRMRK